MTRLLDRYIMGTFFAALGVFTIAFAALFTVVDFAAKLTRFLALDPQIVKMPIAVFMAKYYALRFPMILTYLLPTVVLFAAIFTVIKMSRNNELLPIVTSGTSLRRTSVPFLVAAFGAALIMAGMDEFVLAKLGDPIAETEEILSSQGFVYGVGSYDGRTYLYSWKYDNVSKEMRKVRITCLNEQAHATTVVEAEICGWDPRLKRWRAFNGEIQYPGETIFPEGGGRPVPRSEPIDSKGYVVEAFFTPEEVRRSSFTSQFPFSPLRELLEKARRYPHIPSFLMKVYSRFAFPLSPMVLLLLGLPFIVATTSKSFIRGLLLCFLLAMGYYVAHFAFLDLGNRGAIPPLVAGWTPTGLFGSFGIAAFLRMRT